MTGALAPFSYLVLYWSNNSRLNNDRSNIYEFDRKSPIPVL
jgi:hypothetical protein